MSLPCDCPPLEFAQFDQFHRQPDAGKLRLLPERKTIAFPQAEEFQRRE